MSVPTTLEDLAPSQRDIFIVIASVGLLLPLLVVTNVIIYRLVFHPLAKFPGPMFAACTELWYINVLTSGRSPFRISEVHKKYGDVVRTAPNELSFRTANSHKDIYGYPKGGKLFTKSDYFYKTPHTRYPNVGFVQDPVHHRIQRKTLAPAFSAQAQRDNEDHIRSYIERFVARLGTMGGPETVGVNMSIAYNWLTFDIVGDLTFGESFHSIENWAHSKWVTMTFNFLNLVGYQIAFNRLGVPNFLLEFIVPQSIKELANTHERMTRSMVGNRIKQGLSRGREDIFANALRQGNMLRELMDEEANAVTVAGSETLATFLAGTTYFLLKTPPALTKLQSEVRGAFNSPSEINGDSTRKLLYLGAIIEEGLRIFPPASHGLPRVSPGAMIDGFYVPAGTDVSTATYAVNHDAKNFHSPESFIPERWLGGGLGDNLEASKPFSLGTRACAGMNLAYLEMRVILAMCVYAYDWELVNTELDWFRDLKYLVLWDKPELLVRYHPRKDDT